MIDEREDALTRALSAVAGDPAPPCGVDIAAVVAAGRRDRRRRRAWKVGAAAALAAVIVGGGLTVRHGGNTDPAPAARPHKHAAAAPVPALALTLTQQNPRQVLEPGGPAATVLMKVTNTTGAAEQFTGQVTFWPHGSLTLTQRETDVTFTPVGAAPQLPATATGWTRPVEIPAHTSYTWKAAVRATDAWPHNDNGLGFEVGILGQTPFVINKQMTWYTVGQAKAAGPIVTALTGGTRVAPGRPAVETLTVTNHSGARLDQPLTIQANLFPGDPTLLTLDEWIGTPANGHWQPLGDHTLRIAAGLANGATSSFTLRVRVVSYSAPTSQIHADLMAMDENTTGPGTTADQPLTILRSAA